VGVVGQVSSHAALSKKTTITPGPNKTLWCLAASGTVTARQAELAARSAEARSSVVFSSDQATLIIHGVPFSASLVRR
jgi:hypothetical protein